MLAVVMIPLVLVANLFRRSSSQAGVPDRLYLIHLALCLREVNRYVPELDRLLNNARFDTPESREALLRGIAEYIRGTDLQSGWIEVDDTARTPLDSETRAKILWQRQMERAGLDPKLPVRRPATRLGGGTAEERCVLGLLFDLPVGAELSSGGLQPAEQCLSFLRREPLITGTLYLYYAPDPGQRLDGPAAAALLQRLRES